MAESLRLLIEFEPDTDPLCGRATFGNEVEHFVGWLALLQVLERAASASGRTGPTEQVRW